MKVHEVHKNLVRRSRKKRVGRGPGSGNGKFAGKGMNGCQSRSGYAAIRGHEGGQMPLFRRLPKRGFSNARFSTEFQVVNVCDLKAFDADATVGAAELLAKGLIKRLGEAVKVLGNGDLDRALTVRAQKFSKSAVEKIEKAGGKAEVI
jgi:large subunit ribosomal protein L15